MTTLVTHYKQAGTPVAAGPASAVTPFQLIYKYRGFTTQCKRDMYACKLIGGATNSNVMRTNLKSNDVTNTGTIVVETLKSSTVPL